MAHRSCTFPSYDALTRCADLMLLLQCERAASEGKWQTIHTTWTTDEEVGEVEEDSSLRFLVY